MADGHAHVTGQQVDKFLGGKAGAGLPVAPGGRGDAKFLRHGFQGYTPVFPPGPQPFSQQLAGCFPARAFI
jgi:hypothetical protein